MKRTSKIGKAAIAQSKESRPNETGQEGRERVRAMHRRDVERINAAADYLNKEALDVLSDQWLG
ncbi:MAG TPA: hypothetical protein VHU89_14220 [Acidobacteriaceae bacterium]|jgi:hypothetical protein|nr:hypothetical protein [Acidobacteriaceae bacterium]